MKDDVRLEDISREERSPLIHLDNKDLKPLPPPFESPEKDHNWTSLSEQAKARYECILDDTCAVNIPQPKSKEEEFTLVAGVVVQLTLYLSLMNITVAIFTQITHHLAVIYFQHIMSL